MPNLCRKPCVVPVFITSPVSMACLCYILVLIQCRFGKICNKSSSRNRVGLVVLVSLTSSGKFGVWLDPRSLDKCTSGSFRDRVVDLGVLVMC